MIMSYGEIKTIELTLENNLEEQLKDAFNALYKDFTFSCLRLVVKYTYIEITLFREDRLNEENLIKKILEFIENHSGALEVSTVILPDETRFSVNLDWSLKRIQKVLGNLGYTIPNEGEKIGECWFVGSPELRENAIKRCME